MMIGMGLSLSSFSGGDALSRYAITNAAGQSISPIGAWDAFSQVAFGPASIPIQTLFANTRNGAATYVDASGAIVPQPALNSITDHYIDGLAHALFQPSRTNDFTHSGNFVDTDWGSFRTTLSQGDAAPLSGEHFTTGTASETNNNGSALAAQTKANQVAGTYTCSAHAKEGPLDTGWLLIVIADQADGGNRAQGWVNVSTGEIGTASVTGSGFSSPSIVVEEMPNGVFRGKLTYTQSGTVSIFSRFYIVNGNGTFAVTGGKDLQGWGAQHEPGAFATTYIPTAGSSVTRLADRALCALTTLPIDVTGGTIFIYGRVYYNVLGSAFPRVLQIDDGSSANRVMLSINESAGGFILTIVAGGVTQSNVSISYTSGAEFILGIRFETDATVLSLNGSNSSEDTSVTLPSGLTHIRWATNEGGGDNSTVVALSKFLSFAHEFTTAEMNAETGA